MYRIIAIVMICLVPVGLVSVCLDREADAPALRIQAPTEMPTAGALKQLLSECDCNSLMADDGAIRIGELNECESCIAIRGSAAAKSLSLAYFEKDWARVADDIDSTIAAYMAVEFVSIYKGKTNAKNSR